MMRASNNDTLGRTATAVTQILTCLVALLTVSIRGAIAQETADVRLGPDDVIEISVRNHENLDKTLTILPNGKITYVGVGEILVAGRTPHDVATMIEHELSKTYNNLSVTVAVKEMHSRRVRVIGGVKLPGAYDLKSNWRVFDVLAAAGGLTVKPSRISARLIRGGIHATPLALAALIALPESEANIKVEPDDILLLEEQEPSRHQVFVMGQVNKPGAYELEDGMSLLSLLSLAGNTTERAALAGAYVMRGPTRFALDLHRLVSEGKADPAVSGFAFQPGDLLFVPANEARYAVMGRVNKSGFYAFPETGGLTVLDAINLAGGTTSDADGRHVGIVHLADGKPQPPVQIDLDMMLRKGSGTNIGLRPNDILYVPARSARGFNWAELLAPISALNLLGFRL